MTFIYEFDAPVDILKMYLCTKNEVSRSRLSKVRGQTGQTDTTENVTVLHSRVVYRPNNMWLLRRNVMMSVEKRFVRGNNAVERQSQINTELPVT